MKRRQIFASLFALAGAGARQAGNKPERRTISKTSTPSQTARLADIRLRAAPIVRPDETQRDAQRD
jgi:hypothetical protein